jgi:hypothetical protein
MEEGEEEEVVIEKIWHIALQNESVQGSLFSLVAHSHSTAMGTHQGLQEHAWLEDMPLSSLLHRLPPRLLLFQSH